MVLECHKDKNSSRKENHMNSTFKNLKEVKR
jgi:hypothetical protein